MFKKKNMNKNLDENLTGAAAVSFKKCGKSLKDTDAAQGKMHPLISQVKVVSKVDRRRQMYWMESSHKKQSQKHR